MRHSYTWKFGLALILIAVISLGLMAFSIHWSTTRQFASYIKEVNTDYKERLTAGLSTLYSHEDGWTNLQTRLQYFPHSKNDRLLVTDTSGIIVGDSNNELVGSSISTIEAKNGTPIDLSGEVVGELYIMKLSDISDDHDNPFSGSHHGNSPPPPPEQRFLNSVINSLWIALVAIIVIAFLLGLFLARQITRPVQKLQEGTRRIAAGDLGYRVAIDSKDEIGEMARSFNSMATSLEKAEQSRRQLNADIAHELRTPLTIIQGTVEGIMDGVFKADKEHLETIKHQATLLTRLTQDIRELSLVESGQLKLQPEPTDINTIIQHMISQIKTKGIEKNVTIAFNGDQNLPVIKLDPVRIGQAIANLLTNALHYAPHGSIITVSSKLEINNAISLIDKPAVLISVADSGKGITPEHLPYIFERFYRVDNSRARNEGGTGLGLAIVKQMVEAHGGKVRVESLPGKGSIFYIALPTNDEL